MVLVVRCRVDAGGSRDVHVVTVRCYESVILKPDGTI